MDANTALFYVFSAVLLFAAFRVITARSPVYAALFLVLAFFSAACIWILLRAEFLAIALVLVYVGAVMVLFLFVVMMLDVDIDALRAGFWQPLSGRGAWSASSSRSRWRRCCCPASRLVDAPAAGAAALKLGNTKRARHRGLHRLSLPAADRRGAAAGRDHRRDLADAARAQGLQAHGSVASRSRRRKADRVRIVSMKPEEVPRDAASDAAKPVGDRR